MGLGANPLGIPGQNSARCSAPCSARSGRPRRSSLGPSLAPLRPPPLPIQPASCHRRRPRRTPARARRLSSLARSSWPSWRSCPACQASIRPLEDGSRVVALRKAAGKQGKAREVFLGQRCPPTLCVPFRYEKIDGSTETTTNSFANCLRKTVYRPRPARNGIGGVGQGGAAGAPVAGGPRPPSGALGWRRPESGRV